MKREVMKTGEYKMKRTLACLMILTALCALPALAATTTVTGVVTCDMCAGKHMIPGKTDADCPRACIRRGAHIALAVNDKLYLLKGKTAEVDALAGQKA